MDYSDSLLLYSPQGQAAYESAQGEQLPYFELVTKPEHEHLEAIAPAVSAVLPLTCTYIDLGPGTEHKAAYFFTAFKKRGLSFVYTPVDVSDHFLRLSTEYATRYGVAVEPLRISFEELAAVLGRAQTPRFVTMLGLTYGNYRPKVALDLLRDSSGEGGYALFDVQLAERVDMAKLEQVYQTYVAPACDEKIRLLDLVVETDVSKRVAGPDLEITCTLKAVTPALAAKGVNIGDRLVLFRSHRPTKEELETMLTGFKYQLFDANQSFVSVLVRF